MIKLKQKLIKFYKLEPEEFEKNGICLRVSNTLPQ